MLRDCVRVSVDLQRGEMVAIMGASGLGQVCDDLERGSARLSIARRRASTSSTASRSKSSTKRAPAGAIWNRKDRRRLPVLSSAPKARRRRERRAPARLRRRVTQGTSRKGARCLARVGLADARRSFAEPALRRATATRRDRACDRERARAPPRRRADGRARLRDHRPGDGALSRLAPTRHHRRARDARSGDPAKIRMSAVVTWADGNMRLRTRGPHEQ